MFRLHKQQPVYFVTRNSFSHQYQCVERWPTLVIMPALVLFGRRSRVGSDDLYCPALFLILYQIPFVLIALLYISFWRQCSTMSFDIHGVPWWFMLGAIPIYGFMACVYLVIMNTATKGTIVDHEHRMLMPRILHVHMTWSFVMFAYGVMGLVFWYHLDLCYPDERFVLVCLKY